jgi:hypothetical protein
MHDVKGLIAQRDALIQLVHRIAAAVVCELPQGFGLLPITDDLRQALQSRPVDVATLPPTPLPELFPELHALALAISDMSPVVYVSTEYFGGAGGQDAAAWQGRALVFSPASRGYDRREWPDSSISQALRTIGVAATAGEDEFDALGLGRHRETHRWAAAYSGDERS